MSASSPRAADDRVSGSLAGRARVALTSNVPLESGFSASRLSHSIAGTSASRTIVEDSPRLEPAGRRSASAHFIRDSITSPWALALVSRRERVAAARRLQRIAGGRRARSVRIGLRGVRTALPDGALIERVPVGARGSPSNRRLHRLQTTRSGSRRARREPPMETAFSSSRSPAHKDRRRARCG